jgi:ATP-dependent Zn protease
LSEVCAYHEAGHALLAIKLGGSVHRLTIEPEQDDGPLREGDVEVHWPAEIVQDKRDLWQRSIQVALAGPAAEMIYIGEVYHPGRVQAWSSDWHTAAELATHLVRGAHPQLTFLEQTTAALVRELSKDRWWNALAAIADELLAHETLEREEIAEVVAFWLP